MQTSSPAPQIPSTTITNSEGETPTISRPSTPSDIKNPSSSHLPIHAGFDLNAIKNVLQEVERDPSKSQPPLLPAKKFFSRFTSSSTASPSRRHQSTPPSSQPIEDMTSRTLAGSASREDLTIPSFSRSASYNVPKWKDEEGDGTYHPSTSTSRKTTSSFNNFGDDLSYVSRTPHPRQDDSITLSDDITPSWGASSLSVNMPSSSINHSLYNRGPASPPVMPNPFASSSTLAFGSEASVNGGTAFQADPWSIPSNVKKTTLDSYGSNSPWS